MIFRKAEIKMKDQRAGILNEDEEGYHFQYDPDYIRQGKSEPISLNFPFDPGIGPILSPAYDLVATYLINPEEDEDLALTLNGKKKKIKKEDFQKAFSSSGLTLPQQKNIFQKMRRAYKEWKPFISISFLPRELQIAYVRLVEDRFGRLE